MTVKVIVLPSQEDIARIHAGRRPRLVLERAFETPAELAAYKAGISRVADEFDAIGEITVAGCKVTLSRQPLAPKGRGEEDLMFKSPAEACAFSEAFGDSERFESPIALDENDRDYRRVTTLLATQH